MAVPICVSRFHSYLGLVSCLRFGRWIVLWRATNRARTIELSIVTCSKPSQALETKIQRNIFPDRFCHWGQVRAAAVLGVGLARRPRDRTSRAAISVASSTMRRLLAHAGFLLVKECIPPRAPLPLLKRVRAARRERERERERVWEARALGRFFVFVSVVCLAWGAWALASGRSKKDVELCVLCGGGCAFAGDPCRGLAWKIPKWVQKTGILMRVGPCVRLWSRSARCGDWRPPVPTRRSAPPPPARATRRRARSRRGA